MPEAIVATMAHVISSAGGNDPTVARKETAPKAGPTGVKASAFNDTPTTVKLIPIVTPLPTPLL